MIGRAVGRDASTSDNGMTGANDAASVVIVNYESGPALVGCVEGWRNEGPARVVVVDNGSTDGSTDEVSRRFPDVEILQPGCNLGYGAAANRGVAATDTPWVVVGNPDLEVHAGALAILVGALSADPGCALAGPLIRTAEGERYPSARQFPSLVDAAGHAVLGIFAPDNRFTRTYQKSHLDHAPAGTATTDWSRGPASWCGGTRSSRSGGSTRRTSCTPRMSISAGVWAVPAGVWRMLPMPRSPISRECPPTSTRTG